MPVDEVIPYARPLTPSARLGESAAKAQATFRAAARRKKWMNLLVIHVALVCICAGFILPLAWMISTSLKTNKEAMLFPPKMVPIPPNWKSYPNVINHERVDFPLFARNTVIVAGLAVVGTTFVSAFVAYGFAKVKFRGRGLLFAMMLSTMMIPFPVIMVSQFLLFRWLDVHTPIQFLGTFKPLWLPWWFGTAFNIFLLRQFFMSIPDELSEAARIDGCSDFGIFWRIILPLARPALACVALFTFMHHWNDFLGPLIYLQDPQQYTLALGLQQLQGTQGATTEWNILMAGSVLVVLPVIVLFFLTQRTFIQGIATTGLK
ncbi:MAG: multiple sugar transport system permease protein [Phycisphaerales bacterium]|jgi:multiple sugar transport system permease protein|nr:multiple sugar transport system permease protein [Phycisphaerales bacterium]